MCQLPANHYYQLRLSLEVYDEDSVWEKVQGESLFQGDLSRALTKAQWNQASHLLLPMNILVFRESHGVVLRESLKKGFRPVQQVTSSMLHRVIAECFEGLEAQRLQLQVILDEKEPEKELIREAVSKQWIDSMVLLLTPQIPLNEKLGAWLSQSEVPVYAFAAYQKHFLRWPAEQLAKWTSTWLRGGSIHLQPPPGVDVYEPRLPLESDLDPLLKPVVDRLKKSRPKVSVVIPSYNHAEELILTLRRLNEQNLDTSDYEVVIVDDGSDLEVDLVELLLQENFSMQWRYYYYPRRKKRTMGDSQFRAGLSRNFGANQTRGECLCFLDSDTLVPSNYLQMVFERLQDYDVVQWRRDELARGVCDSRETDRPIRELAPEDVISSLEDRYWGDFYRSASKRGWDQLPLHWKYTCTYALSLKRETFFRLGRFRRTFCFYGFEDTDLGWRLKQAGAKFFFENQPVYHIQHRASRSEFGQGWVRRQSLLQETAQIFFYNNPHPEIYEALRVYL